MALMLWPASVGIRLGPIEATRLTALGVTNVTLLRDAETVAVVLEGWAFNPVRSGPAAVAALGDPLECRVLQPALDVTVSDADTGNGSGLRPKKETSA
jgi:hypothetical protein